MKSITTNNRPAFLLYKSFYAPVKHLKDEELGLLFRTLFEYQDGLEVNELPPQVGMAFAFFKNQFDLDEQKYQVVLERNKSNGSKGGRPKKEETQTNPENPVGFYEPRKGEIEKGKENGIEIEKEIETDKEATTTKERKELKEDKEDRKKPKGFIIPSIQEVKNYCQERKNSVNPEKWFDFYSAKGWKIGKNSMKDWKAAVRTWENNSQSNTNQQPPANLKPNPVKEFNTFMDEEFANRILEDSESVKIFLRSHTFQIQIDSDNKLKNKIDSYFKNKKWELICQ